MAAISFCCHVWVDWGDEEPGHRIGINFPGMRARIVAWGQSLAHIPGKSMYPAVSLVAKYNAEPYLNQPVTNLLNSHPKHVVAWEYQMHTLCPT